MVSDNEQPTYAPATLSLNAKTKVTPVERKVSAFQGASCNASSTPMTSSNTNANKFAGLGRRLTRLVQEVNEKNSALTKPTATVAAAATAAVSQGRK